MEENQNVNVDNVENATEEEIKTEVTADKEAVEKTFTQDEVDKMIQKRLQRERKDIENRIEKEKEEAAKLAKMSEAERNQAILEKKIKEFEEKQKAFEDEKLLSETVKQLATKNLPVEFAELVKGNDAESTFENIKAFEAKFNEALENKVNERLKRKVPKISQGGEVLTKEMFNKMDYSERVNLFNTNKELYDQLNSN